LAEDAPGYRIRDCVEADLVHLGAVQRSAATLFQGVDNGYRGEGGTVSLAVLDLCRAAGSLWIASDSGDNPVGFLAASEIDGSLVILEMSVAREHQRLGLGRALLGKAIDHARWAYLPAVALTTDREIPWNGPFYARHGFVLLDSRRASPGLRALLASEIAAGHDAARRCIMAKLL
jgi:GNAT superfamily N-acetyltransferase